MAEAVFLFWLWFFTGDHTGYDFRNCVLVHPHGASGPAEAECFGPPLPPPYDETEAGVSLSTRPTATPRVRSGRR